MITTMINPNPNHDLVTSCAYGEQTVAEPACRRVLVVALLSFRRTIKRTKVKTLHGKLLIITRNRLSWMQQRHVAARTQSFWKK